MAKDPNLDDAYAMTSADEVKALYRTWAHGYDSGFADGQGYQLPRAVVQAFLGAGGRGPILDVGAGTGLVGERFAALGIVPVDGVDLSVEMLGVARSKAVYRDLIEADITKPLPTGPRYAGVVSAGTFTLGHVGPEGVLTLIEAAAAGAVFVISVNAKHFESAGFAGMISALGDRIQSLTLEETRIYDDRADRAHRDDMARLMVFRLV